MSPMRQDLSATGPPFASQCRLMFLSRQPTQAGGVFGSLQKARKPCSGIPHQLFRWLPIDSNAAEVLSPQVLPRIRGGCGGQDDVGFQSYQLPRSSKHALHVHVELGMACALR